MIGVRIKELRQKKKMTQQELSQGIITRSYISQIEKGKVHPSFDILNKLSKRLECKVEDLLNEPQNQTLLITDMKREIKKFETRIEEGKIEQVLKPFDQLNMKEDLLNDQEIGTYYWIKGKLKIHEDKYNEAELSLNKSIDVLKNCNEYSKYARSLNTLAELFLDKKDDHRAYSILNEAYEIVSIHYTPNLIRASILINLGIVHGKIGEYHTAIRFLSEVKKTNENNKIYFKTGEILISLGICYRRVQNEELAENCYKEALNFFDFFNDEKLRGTAYFNLGILKSHQKEYEKSVEYLLLALNTYKLLNENDNLLQTEIALAKAFMKMHKMNQSQQYCFKVIASTDNDIYKINAYLVLGDSFYNQNDFTNALSYFKEALQIIETNKNAQQKQEEVLIRIGHCYFNLGDFKESGYYYYEALKEK